MSILKNYHRLIIILLLLGVTYSVGIAFRRVIVEAQYREHGRLLPYTLESALYFRRIQQVIETGAVPEEDRKLEYPNPVEPRKIYTLGFEYYFAGLAGLLPQAMPLTERIRWLDVSWFCLGIPLMVLWIRWWTGSWWAGMVSGLFYACSISSVMRSTGLELSRENGALPWLIAHLGLAALARDLVERERPWKLVMVASALCLALSLCSWDMIQFYLYLWVATGMVGLIRGVFWRSSSIRWSFTATIAVLVMAGCLNPYLRAHGFLTSPAMAIGYGVTVCAWLKRADGREPGRRLRWAGLGIPFGLVMLLSWIGADYLQSYGHFTDLLLAKIRFLNRKPLDPSLLDFDASAMWVPALHSATLRLTFERFPAMLVLSIGAALLAIGHSRFRTDSNVLQLVVFSGISFVSFIFFVRFQVYCALFFSAVLGIGAAAAIAQSGWKRWVFIAAAGFGLAMEAGQVLGQPERWGRTGVYYAETAELERWAAENISPEPVLANFGVSASLLAYADCPVLLHPKFETEIIRNRFRQFAEILFRGTEKQFRDWADEQGAGYYVHGLGEFARQAPVIYQMRYFVDAVNPPATVPARLFEEHPESLRYFRMVWENRKYRVFKIRTFADEAEAMSKAAAAELAFQRGDLEAAEREARMALLLDPNSEDGLRVLNHVLSLREKGFSYESR